MYLYHFNAYYGTDRVVAYPQQIDAREGDCLLIQGQYFLVLGTEVARGCEYQLQGIMDYHIAEQQLLTPSSMHQLHRMVREYFSSYKNVVWLRLGSDIEKLLQRKTEVGDARLSKKLLLRDDEQSCVIEATRKSDEQSLLVFPTLWSLHQYCSPRLARKWISIDSGRRTEKQRNSAFWKIKTGETSTLLCTPAGIFQDWKHLQHQHLHQPHQRWYKNRQDPRYDVVDVIQHYII